MVTLRSKFLGSRCRGHSCVERPRKPLSFEFRSIFIRFLGKLPEDAADSCYPVQQVHRGALPMSNSCLANSKTPRVTNFNQFSNYLVENPRRRPVHSLSWAPGT